VSVHSFSLAWLGVAVHEAAGHQRNPPTRRAAIAGDWRGRDPPLARRRVEGKTSGRHGELQQGARRPWTSLGVWCGEMYADRRPGTKMSVADRRKNQATDDRLAPSGAFCSPHLAQAERHGGHADESWQSARSISTGRKEAHVARVECRRRWHPPVRPAAHARSSPPAPNWPSPRPCT